MIPEREREVELTPFITYPADFRTNKANAEGNAIYTLHLRTVSDDKVLEVEIYERDGGWHLRFRVDSGVLLKARGM